MELPEFELTVWNDGGRSGSGRIRHVAAWRLEDGLPAGLMQGFLPPPRPYLRPAFDDDRSFETFSVSREQLLELIRLAEEVAHPLQAWPSPPASIPNRYGIHLDRGDQETTLQWTGRFEDQHPSVRNLVQAVVDLSGGWT